MSEINIQFPRKEKIVNKPFVGIFDNRDRYIILWGGRGSGKSVAAVRLMVIRCLTEPYFKYILIRKVYDTIKESMFEALKYEIELMGLSHLFIFRLSPMEIECINGNKFICRGLDKPEKLKSIKEPSGAWYEEGNQITEDDFITVTTSIRAPRARFLQEVFSFNPESTEADFKNFWIYKYFFRGPRQTFRDTVEMEIDGETITSSYTVIHSTYKDNPHLPKEFIITLEQLKDKNPHYYQTFCLGLWGNKEVGNRFYKTFTVPGQVSALVKYEERLPLHISVDENVNPYFTLNVWQTERLDDDVLELRQIDEITLISPLNTLRYTMEEFIYRYGSHTSGLYIYGDATSKKQDTKLEKGENLYTKIYDFLEGFRPDIRVPESNPAVKSRGEFINDIFSGVFPKLRVLISPKCTNTISDYLYLRQDEDGSKFKEMYNDKKLGARYQLYGHCFAGETLISTINGDKRIDEVKVGDYVYTSKGPKAVTKTFNNGIREVKTYSIGETKIKCTPDHKVWTKEKGFIEISMLIGTGKNTFCIFDKSSNTWKEKLLSITEKNSTDTRARSVERSEYITPDTSKTKKGIEKYICTSINTLSRSATYLKDFIFTTLTKTLLTIQSRTLRQWTEENICPSTRYRNTESKCQKTTLTSTQESRRLSGTDQKRAAPGMFYTLRRLWRKGPLKETVKIAESNLSEPERFVPLGVKTNTTQEFIELANVYDIQVEGEHQYAANQVLVHNCSDANDYFLIEVCNPDFIDYISGHKPFSPMYAKKITNKRLRY